MEWLNLHTSTLDNEACVCSSTDEEGVWIRLLRYCIGQENGGWIRGAKAWPAARWLHAVHIAHEQVAVKTELWEWVGEDLRVKFYPVEKQSEIQAKRRAAKQTHHKRRAQRRAQHGAQPYAQQDAEQPEKGKGNGKEGKSNSGGEESISSIPSQTEGGGDDSGVPTDDEVLTWARAWPGEMASGTPKISEGYAVYWIGRITSRTGECPWPADWRRSLAACWRRDWRWWSEKNKNAGAPRGDTGGHGGVWHWTQREKAIESAIAAHVANEDSAQYDAEHSDEEAEDLARLRAELKEVKAALAGGAQ